MVALIPFAFSCVLLFASVVDASTPCIKPAVRREWSTLSVSERTEWLTAVKCLANTPRDPGLLTPSVDPAVSLIPPVNPNSSYFDDLVYIHMDLNVKIHYTGFFLPWHRAYVQALETALHDKCGFNGTQPYWDWSLHTEDFFNSDPIFDPSTTSGFGSNGDIKNDWQVSDGVFSECFPLVYPIPHILRRNFTLEPWFGAPTYFTNGDRIPLNENRMANTTFSKDVVKKLVEDFDGDYVGFQGFMETFQGAHGGVHIIIGADMVGGCPAGAPASCIQGPKWSGNDPLFFMHHAMVDKVWSDWQHHNPSNLMAFRGGSIQPLQNNSAYNQYPNGEPPYLNYSSPIPADGMFEQYTVADMLDTTGGKLCYVYE